MSETVPRFISFSRVQELLLDLFRLRGVGCLIIELSLDKISDALKDILPQPTHFQSPD